MCHPWHPTSQRTPGTVLVHPGGSSLKPRVVAYVPPVEPQKDTRTTTVCSQDALYHNSCQKPMLYFLQEEPAGAGTQYQAPPERQARRAGSSSSPSCWNHVQPHKTLRGLPSCKDPSRTPHALCGPPSGCKWGSTFQLIKLFSNLAMLDQKLAIHKLSISEEPEYNP